MRNRDRFLYSVALFLSILIVTIPFYTASAYAAIQAKVTGLDGVTGYTKDDFQTDDIVYQVIVDPVPANATVTTSQIYANDNLYFSDSSFCDKGAACSPIEPVPGVRKYNCTCFDDWTPTGMAATFTFNYDSDNSPPPDATSAPIIVRQDYKPPLINSYQLAVSGGAVEATYSVTDKACDYAGCTCTGVAGIVVKDETGNGKLQAFTVKPGRCTETGTLRFNYSGADGMHNFTFTAYDRFWKDAADDKKHAGNATKQLFVDTTPPKIQSLKVTKGGLAIGYLPASGSISGVDLESTVKDLSLSKVSFNLADLGGGTSDATCSAPVDNVYNCTLSGASIKLGTDKKSGVVKIYAEDTLGNNVSKNVTLTFKIDKTGPVFNALAVYPSVTVGNKTYVGHVINVSASITESESGLVKGDVLLNFQGTRPASNCTAGWVCEWWDVAVPQMEEGALVTMALSPNTKDAVGNKITGVQQNKFYADTKAPVYVSSSITPQQTGVVLTNESVIKKGDVLDIEYNLTDAGSGVAYFVADLSKLMGSDSYQNATGSCSQVAGKNYTCTLTTPAIAPASADPVLKFTWYDTLMNKGARQETIHVYDVQPKAVNCFSLNINKDYILPIEVNTLKYFPGTYYEVVPFKLNWTGECNKDTEIFSPALVGSCSGGSKVNIASGMGGADISGFFQFAIDPAAINPAWANIEVGGNTTSCGLHYFDVVQNTIYTEPEVEDVAFTIPLSNDLIPPDVNLEKEINNIRDKVDTGLKNLIATITKLIEILQAICRIKMVFEAIDAALGSVVSLLAGVAAIVVFAKPALKAAQGIKGGFETVKQAVFDNAAVEAVCGIVMCDYKANNVLGVVFGGGACKVVRDFLGDKLKISGIMSPVFSAQDQADYLRAINVEPASYLELSKKSSTFALLCLCLPGYLYNLEKGRQIDCWEGLCYRDMIQAGVPFVECQKQYDYEVCVYKHGAYGALIDFFGFTNILNMISSVLKDPVAHVWSAAKYGANKLCADTTSSSVITIASCVLAGGLGIYEGVETIKQYISSMLDGSYWKSGRTDYCKQFLDPFTNTTTTTSSATTIT